MDDDHSARIELSPQRRNFLESLLRDVRASDLPNNGELIRMLEETLAGKPIGRARPRPHRKPRNDAQSQPLDGSNTDDR